MGPFSQSEESAKPASLSTLTKALDIYAQIVPVFYSPSLSLKTAILQLSLPPHTMWDKPARANTCDPHLPLTYKKIQPAFSNRFECKLMFNRDRLAPVGLSRLPLMGQSCLDLSLWIPFVAFNCVCSLFSMRHAESNSSCEFSIYRFLVLFNQKHLRITFISKSKSYSVCRLCENQVWNFLYTRRFLFNLSQNAAVLCLPKSIIYFKITACQQSRWLKQQYVTLIWKYISTIACCTMWKYNFHFIVINRQIIWTVLYALCYFMYHQNVHSSELHVSTCASQRWGTLHFALFSKY